MKFAAHFTNRRITRLAVALLVCCLAGSFPAFAHAQNAKINLDFLNKLAAKASKSASVSLNQSMLQAAAANLNAKNNAQGKAFLEHLKGVYVRSFTFDKPGEYSHADLEKILDQLRSGGWVNIVNAEKKAEGETSAIYEMNEGGEMIGMVIVAAKPKKLSVVNIVGPMDFNQLSNLDEVFNATGVQPTSGPHLVTRAH